MTVTAQIKTILDDIKALKSDVAALRKRAPLGNTSISKGSLLVQDGGDVTIADGGNLIIQGGGSVLIEDAAANILIRLGQGPDGNYGLVVNDDSGNPQIRAGELASGGYGLEAVDASGVLVQLSTLAFGLTANSIFVFPAETTSSATLTDLATVGPSVTCQIGTSGRALVSVTCYLAWTLNRGAAMGFAISGATTRAADGNQILAGTTFDPSTVNAAGNMQATATFLVTGLNPGANTFTAKYQSLNTGSVSFGANRIIAVQPF